LSRSSTYPTPLDNEQIAILLKQALDLKCTWRQTGQDEFLYLAENINNLEQWSDSLWEVLARSVEISSTIASDALRIERKTDR
jgi:hypothetical protein